MELSPAGTRSDLYRSTVDRSLVIARKEDILFSPLTPSGKGVLKRVKTQQKRRALQYERSLEVAQLVDSEQDVAFLRGLDPVKWKEQDHYRVVGLKHLREKATEDDIKKAYRLRVLKHHPDKRQSAGEFVNTEDGDYFSCIVKAYEILSNPAKRRAYDSVDPLFDNYTPPKTLKSPEDFFTIYGKWFALNAQWSTRQPVPLLGNFLSTQHQVDSFYEFWYDFDSWREYSYLDEEDKEQGHCREERRFIEKENKAQRAKLKKEEMARVRSVVESAFRLDPRVALYKELSRLEKLEKKLAKQKAYQAEKEHFQKVKEEEKRVAKEEEVRRQAEEQEKEAAAKKIRDAQKKALKKERKSFRTLCKTNNYYGLDDDEKSRVENMAKMEQLCEILELDELAKLNESLEKLGLDESRQEFEKVVKTVAERIAEEKAKTAKEAPSKQDDHPKGKSSGDQEWGHEELQLLIKAVNLFPAGTAQRWEVVANFINQHQSQDEPSSKGRTAKELEVEAESGAASGSKSTENMVKVWTAQEQKLLEQALKTYSAAAHPGDRWEKVAESVPGRSKKECMARFKELAALVKAKKSAQSLKE
ncbi:DnaJ subfamily C member 2 [Orchesella cincta]|uniref:DnaJ subfamily C member 2 n=1 Tax=Orchesella cincta TaxID=48709 RepID=A0A1D2MBN4_ORCCI|nr:DnaJ subfamily C member 2 [Orchesella cincta]